MMIQFLEFRPAAWSFRLRERPPGQPEYLDSISRQPTLVARSIADYRDRQFNADVRKGFKQLAYRPSIGKSFYLKKINPEVQIT
jgi:hypothetical protein